MLERDEDKPSNKRLWQSISDENISVFQTLLSRPLFQGNRGGEIRLRVRPRDPLHRRQGPAASSADVVGGRRQASEEQGIVGSVQWGGVTGGSALQSS